MFNRTQHLLKFDFDDCEFKMFYVFVFPRNALFLLKKKDEIVYNIFADMIVPLHLNDILYHLFSFFFNFECTIHALNPKAPNKRIKILSSNRFRYVLLSILFFSVSLFPSLLGAIFQ